MDKPEKDMPNKANPEKGKAEIDVHQSDKDRVPKQYSNPNDLKNLLMDIEDYEGWAKGSNMFNSSTSDRITPEAPDESPKAKKITKAYKYLEDGKWVDSNNPKAPPGQLLPSYQQQGANTAYSPKGNVGHDNWSQSIQEQEMAKHPPAAVNTMRNQPAKNPAAQPTPLGAEPEPKPGHLKNKILDFVTNTNNKALDTVKHVFKTDEPMQNVNPSRTALLRIVAKESQPDKDQTGVTDSTIKDIQDDDALVDKELEELLTDTHAFMEYIGLSDADETPKKKLNHKAAPSIIKYKDGTKDKCTTCGKAENNHFVQKTPAGYSQPACYKSDLGK